MTYDEARQAIVGLVKAPYAVAFPSVPLVFENDPFDWNNPGERVTECEISFLGGSQVGSSATPKTRAYGYVYVTAHTRKGLGSKVANEIRQWFATALEYQTLGSKLKLQAAEPDGEPETAAWFDV